MKNLKKRYRYSIILLKELVRTDFKLKYQGSILGYLWSLLRPLLIFLILYIVFTKFLKIGSGIQNYPVYLLLGILLWNYFVEVTSGSVNAIVGKSDLLRKINFPKYVIIFAISISALINLSLTSIVIVVFMYIGHVTVTLQSLWLIPLIIELILISTGVAFFLSTAFVRFRDISYIWEVLIQAAFYATPILYPLGEIPASAAKLLILNPVAQVIQDSRNVLVTKQADNINTIYGGNIYIWLIPTGLTIVTVTLSALYFRNKSRYFAEEA